VGRAIAPVWLLAALAALSLMLWARSPLRAQPARAALAPASTPLPLNRRPDGAWQALRVSQRAPHRAPQGHLVAYVHGAVTLRARPFGRILERLPTRTQFGSPRALSVVRARSGRWLAVTTPELGNRTLGWIDARAGGLSYARTRLAIEIDLSRRTLVLRSDARVLHRGSVGIGRPGSPTPTGRFAVTDKLDGSAYSPVYGCCILALSAHQTNVPLGWRGGDRMAIHGGGMGAISAGCVHLGETDLRYLIRLVPLGTPVTIHA
jgi:lipoprotein-anchoring transpeptidase ErfK/SrfK